MTTVTRRTNGPLARHLRRAVQLRRTRGWARVLYAALQRILAIGLLRRSVQLRAVDVWHLPFAEDGQPPRTPALFTVRQAIASDFDELAKYYDDRQRILQRCTRGDICVLALCQNKIEGAVWLCLEENQFDEDREELRCTFGVPRNAAWTYDGKGTKLGAWGTLMKQLPGILRRLRVNEVYTTIDCNNWQSFDAHRSLRYEPVGVLLMVRLLGFAVHAFKPSGQRWRRLPFTIKGLEVHRTD